MIEITKIKTYGWEEAIRGMRNSYNSWDKCDSEFNMSGAGVPVIGPNDLTLMKKLCNAGSDHCKFRRMITVSMDINAPLYFWKEFDTYKVGTVANSCSTMHKIAEEEFTMDSFSHEQLIPGFTIRIPIEDDDDDIVHVSDPRESLQKTIDLLNEIRHAYQVVSTDPYRYPAYSAKEMWWQMIQLLPSSYNQKRTVTMNYEVLANIYKSRRYHPLNEWKTFCKVMESTLPYPELFTSRK